MKQFVKPYDERRPVRFDVEGSGEIQTLTLLSHVFRNAMKLLEIKLENIQKHTPEDNGNIESFHNSIKTDFIWPNEFADIYEARKMVKYAFNDYNQVRPHSLVMYLPPSEFRRRWESGEEFRVEYVKFLASVKRKTEKYENKIKKVEANGI